MDSKQFDELVARLASGQSRRKALKGIAGGALATVGVTSVAAAQKKGRLGAERCLAIGEKCPKRLKHGRKQKRHSCGKRCCTRYFERAPDGKRRCACKSDGAPCDENRNCCSQRCVKGFCEDYGGGAG